MVHEFNPAQDGSSDASTAAQLDLLAALLSAEDAVYPWNPADLNAAAYFDEQDEELAAQTLSESETTMRSQKFHTHLEQLWSKMTPEASSLPSLHNHCLQTNLHQRFAAYVPGTWLSAIAHQVKDVSTAQSLAEQLVQCVGVLIPSLAKADLLVLAQPFADQMHSANEPVKFVFGYAQHCDWKELSEVEHAKASLAIARYAIFHIAEAAR